MQPPDRTAWVIQQAQRLGFDLCGVAPVEGLAELERLPEWLERGFAGAMAYLRNSKRLSPTRVLPGARSIIVCALNYNTALPYSTEALGGVSTVAPLGWVSRYAWGDDYHEILRRKLEALIATLHQRFSEQFEARAYVDTGPVVERVAAKYAGLGWLAKNTCLIHEGLGSWLFLGVVLTTLDLARSLARGEPPPPDLCGNCRLCIDACPTGAIVEPYVLDARRCISYLTIELRGSIPEEFRPEMGRMVFGCDICQDVCPWNRKAPATNLTQFLPRNFESSQPEIVASGGRSGPLNPGDSLFLPELERLALLSEEEFRKIFRGSAVKRAKWHGLVRNACVALGNSGISPGHPAFARVLALLERLAGSADPLIAEHAAWAHSRLVAHSGSGSGASARGSRAGECRSR